MDLPPDCVSGKDGSCSGREIRRRYFGSYIIERQIKFASIAIAEPSFGVRAYGHLLRCFGLRCLCARAIAFTGNPS
jgi:hypothetical protein